MTASPPSNMRFGRRDASADRHAPHCIVLPHGAHAHIARAVRGIIFLCYLSAHAHHTSHTHPTSHTHTRYPTGVTVASKLCTCHRYCGNNQALTGVSVLWRREGNKHFICKRTFHHIQAPLHLGRNAGAWRHAISTRATPGDYTRWMMIVTDVWQPPLPCAPIFSFSRFDRAWRKTESIDVTRGGLDSWGAAVAAIPYTRYLLMVGRAGYLRAATLRVNPAPPHKQRSLPTTYRPAVGSPCLPPPPRPAL